MLRIRSFRGRVFAALMLVAVVPGAILIGGGVLALRGVGATTGTLGPWDAVAESGQRLIDAATAAAPDDSALAERAREHGDALSASVRQSRVWGVLSDRVLELLPVAALLGLATLAGISAWVARSLARSLSAPVGELVGWTALIARGKPLPPPEETTSTSREFRALREALRGMARSLEDARRRELESAQLRAWTEMARRVSHELKNPLTPMRMSAAALARSGDPAVREPAEILLEEVARLDEMARTFSQFGRPPEGPTAPVDLEELLERVVNRYRQGEVPVGLRVRGPVPRVEGHHDMIERAVRNLLENAVEAVREGGGTRVGVILEGARNEARVEVSDDGPGVPEDLLEEIWLPDVTTRHRGTGLGLALVRRTAEIHGGEAVVQAPPEGGARFRLVLPVEGPGGTPGGRPGTEGRARP
jgi:signal transduction histidine kinase